MRILLFGLLLVVPLTVFAMEPDYSSSLAWVKKRAPANHNAGAQYFYIASVPADTPSFAMILAYTNGVRIRTVVDGTRYKNSDARVYVLRSTNSPLPVFKANIGPKDDPDVIISPFDVILISAPDLPRK